MITTEQLKAAVDPVEIIGETVKLRKLGRRYGGLCPFHSEKTPSFSFWESSRRWMCFGCGKGGDIITFIQLNEGLDFRRVKRRLAEHAGIELDERDTFTEPSLTLKLSGPEVRAFDNWLGIEMHRLAALGRFLDQQEAACLTCLEGHWNAPDEQLKAEAIEGLHRSLNHVHEAKQQVDDQILELDTDCSAAVEPFLRRLYGSEDFRAAVAGINRDKFAEMPWWVRVPTLADIEYKPVAWLVEPFLPRGAFVLLVGKPGTFKSWLCLDLARAVSRGERFAQMQGGPARDVL